MQTTVSREGPTRIRMTVEVAPDEIKPAADRAFKQLAKQVKIPGFRPGKAPRSLLEARLGKDEVKEMIVREAVPQFYAQAVVGEDIDPVAPPQIEVTSFEVDEPLIFEAIVEVRPEIDLPDINGLKVTRPPFAATDEDVQNQLERLADRFASLETVERPATEGDFVLIDIKGYWNDEEIDNATANDMLYEAGSGRIVPELDAEVLGKKAGDILKFNAELPPTFGSTWGGREVTFQVLVKEVRQKNTPALDDEFAKTASEFETLGELKADLADKITRIKRSGADAEVRSRMLDVLVNAVPVAAPDAMVDEEVAYRLHRLSDQLRGAGVSLDDYLTSAEATEQEIEADIRKQAERSVSAQLILEEIARREELTVEEAELDEEIGRLAEASGENGPELRKRLEQAGRVGVVAGDILRRKALDLVVEKADIKEENADAE
ncbi:MAG TPA: trigger factor [Actinomycetota bacterium]|nr:trigger factor [Actinomycetota bacterium]